MDTHERTTPSGTDNWQSASQPDGNVPAGGLWQTIWRGRRVVLLTMLVGAGAAALYLTQAPLLYTSTSRLYVEQAGPKIMTETEGVMTQSKNYLFTQAELLRSAPIISAALDEAGGKGLKTLADVDNPVAYLRMHLNTEVGKKDDLISVSLESKYPEEAARLVNSIVDAYVTYHSRKKRSVAVEVLNILRKEKTESDADLAAKLKAMLAFKQTNGTLSFEEDDGSIVTRSLVRISEALTDARLAQIERTAIRQAAEAMKSDPLKAQAFIESHSPVGRSSAFYNLNARLNTDLRQAQQEMINLQPHCTADHPAMQAAKARIADLAKQLSDHQSQFVESYLAVIVEEEATAVRKVADIQATYDQQRIQARKLDLKQAEKTILASDIKRTERMCDALDARIKELNVTEDTGALNINILEAARAEYLPTSPKMARVILISLAGGLVGGIFLILVRGQMDQRFASTVEVTTALGMPVLGTIPFVAGKESAFVLGQKVILEPTSCVAEAYRAVRTAVYFSAPDNGAKTLLITSPVQGDGKSTLVSNLAIAMAQAGQRTLIIDADLRRPRQHEIFGVSRGPGFTNVLVGEVSLDEATRPTALDGVDLLTAGPIPPNPSELLSSPGFAKILKELSGKYDRILLDSPPVLPVTDASILAAICDATILVLNVDVSTRRPTIQACQGLASVGANVFGVVLNSVPHERDSYGYYGHRYAYAMDKTKRTHAESDVKGAKSEAWANGDGPGNPPTTDAADPQEIEQNQPSET